MKKNVRRDCKCFYEEEVCPSCKSTNKASNWKGRITFVDIERSDIAKKIGVTTKGEYAIKVR